MASTIPDYPWFAVIDGDAIEQGEILESCPVFLPPDDLVISPSAQPTDATFTGEDRDLIVMSQSCDLAKGREKVDDILLCAVWKRSELKTGHLAKDDGMEQARKGQLPGFHVLAASAIPDFEREVRVMDFRRVYSLPVRFVRKRAAMSKHLRLLPPYREHLSQSFARFFMRVGLPIDILICPLVCTTVRVSFSKIIHSTHSQRGWGCGARGRRLSSLALPSAELTGAH